MDLPPEIILEICDSYEVVSKLKNVNRYLHELITLHTNLLVKKLLRYTYIIRDDQYEKVWWFGDEVRILHGRAVAYKMSKDRSYCYVESVRNYQWGKLHGRRYKNNTNHPHNLEWECYYNRGRKHGIERIYDGIGNLVFERTMFRGKPRGLEKKTPGGRWCYFINLSGRRLKLHVNIFENWITYVRTIGKYEDVLITFNVNLITVEEIESSQDILRAASLKVFKSKQLKFFSI
ncbi:hypothetical protein BNJ_00141 [Kaumoebavirus]|uniref:hypothetical protein n=1 Tax=Kaumoebavirus TaxID=1859492 RepID=UPI0009C30E69|nr:hypothetical protein BNJ_00141 [Kaumoebavirus]ARA71973.1 hypothetical protein BNJ_00141 [Kaumoebavirus]